MAEEFLNIEKHRALETDIERLRAEVQEIQGQAEAKDLSEKEVLRAAIDRIAPEQSERYHTGTSPAVPQDDSGVLPGYAIQAPVDVKLEVESLLDEAFHEGLAGAIKKARKSSPFVLDAFHDTLTGKLYDEFKQRGIFK